MATRNHYGGAKKNPDRAAPRRKEQGLLATRFLKSLPYADAVQDYYLCSKQSNELLRIGLNLAETCVSTFTSPLATKYVKLDQFASKQFDKLESYYEECGSAAGAVAYPVGFSIGLAEFTRDKVKDLAAPVIEKTYDYADKIVDKLLPPDYDETLDEEYATLPVLKQKSPFRRIKNRASIPSVLRLPWNSWILSRELALNSLYLSLGFGNMIIGQLVHSATHILDSVNNAVGLEQLIAHPWTIITGDGVPKIFNGLRFVGGQYLIGSLDTIINQATALSQEFEHRNLPRNAAIPKYLASRLCSIKKRVAKLANIKLNQDSKEVPLIRRKGAKRELETERHATSKHRLSTFDRAPTMIMGDNTFDQRQMDIETHRMPTIMYGDETGRVAKYMHVSAEQETSETPLKKHVTPKKAPAKHAKPQEPLPEFLATVQEATESETPETSVTEPSKPQQEADEQGFITVTHSAHGHTLPFSYAKQVAAQMLGRKSSIPPTPVNSPAVPLPNNPYSSIVVDEDVVEGPEGTVKEVTEASEEHPHHKKHRKHNRTQKRIEHELKEKKEHEEHQRQLKIKEQREEKRAALKEEHERQEAERKAAEKWEAEKRHAEEQEEAAKHREAVERRRAAEKLEEERAREQKEAAEHAEAERREAEWKRNQLIEADAKEAERLETERMEAERVRHSTERREQEEEEKERKEREAKEEREAIERENLDRELALEREREQQEKEEDREAKEEERAEIEQEKEEEEAKEAEEASWEVPKHPVHVVKEEPAPAPKEDEVPAPANNPFAALAELEPETSVDLSARLQEEEREEKEEERAEIAQEKEEKAIEAEKASWEVPKHPVHVVEEAPAPALKPDEVPAAENNPFAKLAEIETEAGDSSAMGMAVM